MRKTGGGSRLAPYGAFFDRIYRRSLGVIAVSLQATLVAGSSVADGRNGPRVTNAAQLREETLSHRHLPLPSNSTQYPIHSK